jgi:signal transduction histidine kinase
MSGDWDIVTLWQAWGQPLAGFLHGLAFFTLGVVFLLLAPRALRLDLARRLPLLAVFGFCEAAAAWIRLLFPGADSDLLAMVRTLLLGVAYVALLAFGLLFPSPVGRRWAHPWPVFAIGVTWLAVLLGMLLGGRSAAQAALWGEGLARYGLALPGGLLAARRLRQRVQPALSTDRFGTTRRHLRAAGFVLGLFGGLAALDLPARAVSLSLSLLYAVCGVYLIRSIVQALNATQDEMDRWIESVEQSQALLAERERISRDLHDGIIQSIYAAGLMLEGATQAIMEDPAAAEAQLGRAMYSLNQTIQDIRRYIFNLRSGGREASDLRSGLEELLRDFRINTLLETELIVEGEEPPTLRADQRGHIFQVAREALSNAARHARARRVEVWLSFGDDALRLRISDDGVGMVDGVARSGQGLRNIRERVRLLEGNLDLDSAPGRGVTMTLTVPY